MISSIPDSELRFCTVMTLGDFLESRMAKVGIGSKQSLILKAGVSRATVFGLLSAKNEREIEHMRFSTLEPIAEALKFPHWSGVLDAWRAQDVHRGLESGAPAPPQSALKALDPLDDLGDSDRQMALMLGWKALDRARREQIVKQVRGD